jgi:DNA-binding transcriptional MerR regulator
MHNNSQKQYSKDRRNKPVDFPLIPDKIYFTIGEVGDLCLVEPYVIRFWEHEFTQLRAAKRRCNRRYYQKEQILLVRKIRNLLYQEGFTIEGARTRLAVLLESGEQLTTDAKTNMEGAHVEREAKNLLSVEKVIEEKIVHVKDKVLLKEIAGDLDEILSLIAAVAGEQEVAAVVAGDVAKA